MTTDKWELCPYQNEAGKWIPRVRIFVEKNGKLETITLEAGEGFEYDEKNEAEKHGIYLAKDYLAR